MMNRHYVTVNAVESNESEYDCVDIEQFIDDISQSVRLLKSYIHSQ